MRRLKPPYIKHQQEFIKEISELADPAVKRYINAIGRGLCQQHYGQNALIQRKRRGCKGICLARLARELIV